MCLTHHKAGRIILDELSDQLSCYLNGCKDEDQWLSRSKDVLTYPMALYLDNKLPASPDQRFTPKGKLKKWMHNRLSVMNSSNTHLWNTWLQCKRATLPVSDAIIEKTYDKHLKTLTKQDDGDDDVINSIMEQPAMMIACRAMSDALEGTLSGNCDFTKLQPSTNACFEASRSQGGQQGELIRMAEVDCSVNIREPVLSKMFWRPDPLSGIKGGGRVYSVYEPEGRHEWSSLFSRVSEKAVLSATIQAVLEPMKVRVISKGNALEYYQCRLFQKAMHSSLRTLKPFQLIGKPFQGGEIQDLRRKAEPTWRWLSIDYSAATDNLSWKYSSRIFSEVISGLPQATQDLLMKVLGAHDLYYPIHGGKELRGRMQRGQLMGSILSFPILCLANFGVYCEAMKIVQHSWSIGDIFNHVLVNGDDMLYAAPAGMFELHTEIARKVGLDMSVGKAYEHSTYLNINSVSCHCDLTREQSQIRRIDFLNIGLLFGQHKVQSKENLADDHHTTSGFASCANEVLKGCFRDKASVLKMYLSIHAEKLRDEVVIAKFTNRYGFPVRKAFQRDLFLPVSLGGLGIERPSGFKSQVLRLPQLYASYLIDREICSRRTLDTQYPLQGYEPEIFLEVPSQPWHIASHADLETSVDLRKYQKMPPEWRLEIFKFFRHGIFVSVSNRAHLA